MKKTVILEQPKQYSVSLNFKTKEIQFQHPLCADEKGYGVIVHVACGRRPGRKLSDEDRIEIKRQAERLMTEAPRSLPTWALDPELARQYFKWMPEDTVGESPEFKSAQKFHSLLPEGEVIRPGVPTVSISQRALDTMKYQELHWKDLYEKEVKLRKKAEAELAQNIIDSGNRHSEEKAITLIQAFEHWQKNQCGYGPDMPFSSQQASEDCQRRVKTILTAMDLNSKVHAHTANTLTTAINDTSKEIADGEKQKRQKAIKRFFTAISLSKQEGGLGISGNPSRTVKAISPEYGNAKPLSPKERLESSLPHYWKTFTATLAYAGLMPSEAFSLEWSNIDYDPKRKDDIGNIIELKKTDTKKSFKHKTRTRAVPPFRALWKWLTEHKANLPKGSKYVFPNPDSENGTWFEMEKGVQVSRAGRAKYLYELEKAGFKDEDPCQRLRHWFSTELNKQGLGQHEHRISGHSKDMAEKHYVENKAVAKTLQMPME